MVRVKGVLLVAVAVFAGVLSGPVPASVAAPSASTSSLALVGPTGLAQQWSDRAGSVIEVIGVTDNGFSFRVVEPDGNVAVSVEVRAPRGETLAVGEYEGADSTSSGRLEDPWMRIAFDGTSLDGRGRFTIHDLPDHGLGSSYWFTFEITGASGRWFGEGRHHVPTPEPELLVTPGRIAWPDEYPGRTADTVPVTLTAQGDAPVVVHDVAVTAGAGEFAVEGHDCAVLDPGESCRVDVGFSPTSPGPRTGTVTVRDSTPAGTHSVTVSGRGVPGVTSWTLDSPPNDGVGGDGRATLTPDAHVFHGYGTATSWSFSFGVRDGLTPPTDFEHGSASFRSDPEHPLVAGETYVVETGVRDPAIDVGMNSIRCQDVTGRFTVTEATYDRGLLASAEVDFEQQCLDSPGTLTGTIRWRADQAPVVPPAGDDTAPAAVTGLRTTASTTHPLTLVWDHSTSPDWVDVVVRGKAGATPPQSPGDGFPVYRGRLSSAHVDDLAMVGEHSFSVFTRDLVGNVGTPATITVPDMVPPDPVTDLEVDVDTDRATLTWRSPEAADFDHALVVVRRWPDDGSSTREIPVGEATTLTVDGIDGDTRWRFDVRVVDETGNADEGTTVMAERTYAAWTQTPSRLTCGQEKVLLEGDLSDVYETWATFFEPVVLQRRTSADQPWADVQENVTLYGGYRFWVSPCVTTSYRIRYDGERHHLPTTGEPVTLRVKPRVAVAAKPLSAPLGTRFVLTTRVAPAQEGLPVKLQRLRGSGWRTVATKGLRETGTARFALRPGSRGRYAYRVLVPASALLDRAVSETVRIRVQ